MNQALAQERTKHSHADFNVEKTNLMLIPSEMLCTLMSTSGEILLTVIGIISNFKRIELFKYFLYFILINMQ